MTEPAAVDAPAPTPARGRRSRLRGALALVVCLILIGLIGLAVPGDRDWLRHRDVPVGQWAENDRYAARVAEVEVARRVERAPDSYGRPVEAPPGAVAVVV
ncbi:MAG: hypothetical protein Q4F67_16050, partial [Propionibacteriaceae bacterium]|nr:hypothetical protein [Propionibacteriaceae bacterium]